MKTIYKKLLLLLLLLPFSVLAQSTLGGTVIDNVSKLPLPGVNVVVKGSATGTQTDFDGKFQLGNLKKDDVVVFSYLGYKNSTLTYASQTNVNIVLEEDANQLQEVVVQVGYGTVKVKDATGSVTAIAAKDFNKGLNVTSESLISGRIAGVNVTGGGAPGAKADIRIRGGSSLNASNDPLIVIDGLPMSNATPSGMTGILSTLNPDDIESFTVLKDASASAIYGSRAANGVIVITTKKGTKGFKVSFNSQTSISVVDKKIDVLSADEFRQFIKEKGTPAQVALLGTANTDWQDEIFRDAVATNNNVSVSGSLFDKLPVRLSVGNTTTPGILKNTSFERTTTSLSLNPTFFDNLLKIDISGNLAFGKNQFQDEGAVIGSAITFDPTQPVYDENSRYGGYFEWLEANGNKPLLPARNPVARLNQNERRSTSTRKWGNVKVDFQFPFFKDLRAIAEVGIDKVDTSGFEENSIYSINGYQPIAFSAGTPANPWVNLGSYSSYRDDRQNKNLNAYLNYVKEFGKLKVDVTGGYNYQHFKRSEFTSGATREPVAPGVEIADVLTEPEINLQSYFGRVNLGFDSRYLLTINYRRDGSSRFSEIYRWGDFMGGAFAWNLSEEAFLKGNKTISNLKLRIGYGETGQQDITAGYDYLKRVEIGKPATSYIFGPYTYQAARIQGYNEFIKWEELKEVNVGIDYGFLDNRISGSINYFHKKSSDLLADIAYPDGANLRNQGFANIGSFETKGIEFAINSDVVKSENFNWNVAFNTTYIEQEVTSLGQTVDGFSGYEAGDNISGGGGNKIKINTVNYAPNSFYVYEQVYDANGKPIQGVYVDRNNDGVINANDRYRHEKPAADYTFGLFSTMSYKQFDFTMNWRASLGNYVFDNVNSDHAYSAAALRRETDLANITTDYFNTEFTFEDNGTQRYLSDYYIKDASFIKLDNVTLGYSFKKDVIKGVGLRFTAGVQNVLTITKYDGIDPERFSGVDGSIYPRARTFIFGVNANF